MDSFLIDCRKIQVRPLDQRLPYNTKGNPKASDLIHMTEHFAKDCKFSSLVQDVRSSAVQCTLYNVHDNLSTVRESSKSDWQCPGQNWIKLSTVTDRTKSDWQFPGQRWVKLNTVLDSAKFPDKRSQVEHCSGQRSQAKHGLRPL